MDARMLSLKAKQFIWFNVVHISHFLNIPATPQKLKKKFYTQEAWKKDTMETNLI